MAEGEWKKKGFVDLEQPPPPPQTTTTQAPPPHPHQQTIPGYVVAGGVPPREPLCCCGLGFGWILFILGFFLGIIPWYIGTILLCYFVHKKEYREKPGCVACAIAAAIITVLIIVKVTTGQPHWLFYHTTTTNRY